MKKFAIKGNANRGNIDVLIFHALPNKQAIFQWYISENNKMQGVPIKEQTYESYTLTSEIIKEKSYINKYLHCEYKNNENEVCKKTEYIKLGANIDSMIKDNIFFDNVSEFDNQGNIKDNLVKVIAEE